MNSNTTPVSATWMLVLSNVLLFPSIFFCARRAYMHETVILICVVIFNSMFYSCQTRDICFDLLGVPLRSLKWIFHVMMFHLVSTIFIFYLDIHPRKFKTVPHLLMLIITSLILFGSPDKEQLLVRVHVNTIIIEVIVILAWFAWLFVKEGPLFFLEKYPIPNLISGFIGIGLTAVGGYAFALGQSLIKNAPPPDSPQTYFFHNGVIKPWVTFLVWHVTLNLATIFLMTTPTSNIFVSVFKMFDPPKKLKQQAASTSPNTIDSSSSQLIVPSSPDSSETKNKSTNKQLESKSQKNESIDNFTQETTENSEEISTTDAEAKELEADDHTVVQSGTLSSNLLGMESKTSKRNPSLQNEKAQSKENKRKKKTNVITETTTATTEKSRKSK